MDEIKMIAVIPHPDDEFAMFGLLIRAKMLGYQVHIVCATKGEAGKILNSKSKLLNTHPISAIRVDEINKSCELLKADSLEFLGLMDGESKSWNYNDAESKLIRIIDEIEPNYIVTFDNNGLNGHPDHKAVTSIVNRVLLNKDEINLIQVTKYPIHFVDRKLRFIPRSVREKIIDKIAIDNRHVSAINELNSEEHKLKMKLINIYNSQFPDENGKYFKQSKVIVKKFSRYESYCNLSKVQVSEMRLIGWNFSEHDD